MRKVAGILVALLLTSGLLYGQFAIIHNFTGGGDGGFPFSGVTFVSGNLYGTTQSGGNGFGVVYRLANRDGWLLSPLYMFAGGDDGAYPEARVVRAPDGSLWGTTSGGGDYPCEPPYGCGTAFRLRPSPTAPRTALAPWQKTTLHQFQGLDGGEPGVGDLVFDSSGAVYGTAGLGGNSSPACGGYGCGVVFKLMGSGDMWTESVLYNFTGGFEQDEGDPAGGVIFGPDNNLYGTTEGAGAGSGTVFQLSRSGDNWTETTIHNLSYDEGAYPIAGLAVDNAGNLYGGTVRGGSGDAGTIFKMSRDGANWDFSVIHNFVGVAGPYASPTVDVAGNVYGTAINTGQYGYGVVFELSPTGSGWTYNVLHDFTGGADGAFPMSQVTIGPDGTLYGTTEGGGTYGWGVVWKISR
jgi:uncharacterized repeat protein (TIGR03803 family)